MRVLIAEDEAEIAKALKVLLERHKYSADIVFNGTDAWDYALRYSYDVIILDIMMPGMDGMEVLRRIREEKMTVPVLMLTAKGEVEDKVAGLEAGADDYLPKPFSSMELIARVKALSRRSIQYMDSLLQAGDITLNCANFELSTAFHTVRLNNKEFQMMELFLRYPNQIFSAERLRETVWDMDSQTGIEVIWTYMGFLRKKLKQIQSRSEIRTVRGAGYMFAGYDRKPAGGI